MSKHATEEGGDFWKKVGYAATVVGAIGTGLYAVTTVVKRQGFVADFIDDVKTAMHTAPQLVNEMPKAEMPITGFQPSDSNEESRAVLELQLEHAMKRGETQRVKEISRQLEELGPVRQSFNASTGSMPHMLQRPVHAAMPTPMSMSTGTTSPVSMWHSQSVSTKLEDGPMQGAAVSDVPVSMSMHAPMSKETTPGMQMPGMYMPAMQMPGVQTPGAQTPGMQMPAMPWMQMPQLQMPGTQTPGMQMSAMPRMQTPDTQAPFPSAVPGADKPLRAPTPLVGDEGAARSRKVARSIDPTRLTAMLQLQGGDVVDAIDPVAGGWAPGTVHAIAKNGLVDVRWDDPGADDKGNPYHPIGEIWAEQIRLKYRPPAAPIAPPSQPEEPEQPVDPPVDPPDGLKIGDSCFALGHVVEKKWFHAKLLDVRARSPPLRIEYVSTLDGQTNELCLPSPRKDFVHMDQVRRDKPEDPPEAPRRSAPKEAEEASQTTEVGEEDRVEIPPDLMCSVCERPDDEPKMLVCDCGKGYHIYCLSPALEAVPDDDWKCPKCAKK